MKKGILFSVIFCLVLSLNVFVAGAGQFGGQSATNKPVTINISIPSCSKIFLKLYDLDLILFKVDGKNVKGFSVSFPTTQPREVELKVKGQFGLVWMETGPGYQYIAIVANGKVYPLPPPPPMP